jgi:flavin reductase (DIM6/NTAB) family NADH-FMN oxidoreductase RutF
MKNSNEIKKALFNIGYGLYVITSRNAYKDNGLIVNSVMQITDNPNRIAVTINKKNYSHDVIRDTKKMVINCLTVEAPFSVFQAFGFRSGRDADKFADCSPERAENGLAVLPKYINAYISLDVEQYIELDTHGLFICTVNEAKVISHVESMTYAYYHANVKPKPQPKAEEKKKGYVCKICGYVYEGDPLPEDFVCPLCKHPASDFEPLA